MGKHESLNSPAKSLQEKKIGEGSSITKTLQEYQQEPMVKNNIQRAIDSERDLSRKKEDTNIRNCNNNESNENNSKSITSHTSNNNNNKKKKRRNKIKSKNSSKGKINSNEDIQESEEQKRTVERLSALNITKTDTQVPALKTSLLKNDREDYEQIDGPHMEHQTPVLDVNLKIDPPIRNDQLQVSNLSPRKQTILRYKKSDDRINERSLISEAKDNLKNKKKTSRTPESHCSKIDESMVSPQANLDMDKKVTLFKYKSSRILVFDEQLNDKKTGIEKPSSGRLLGHGEFEIFQLHNGDVTYLSCGPSFVYPLLPKLKILRIDFNQFILPLVNPERYWKISINSDDKHLIEQLEKTLEKNVKYRNLFFGVNQLNTININEVMKQDDTTEVDKDNKKDPGVYLDAGLNSSKVSEKNEIPFTESTTTYQFPVIFNEIPDSPPSAPLSPHNENIVNMNLVTPTKKTHLLPGWSLKKKQSDQSINSAMASLDVNKDKESIPADIYDRRTHLKDIFVSDQVNTPLKLNHQNQKVHQPKPKRYANLPIQNTTQFQNKIHKPQDNKSDSSMDSLLDEYEENIHTTKSITFNSRPPSRPISVASSFSRPQINYMRGSYFHGPIERDVDDLANSQYNETFEDEIFPTTSLSEYNKTRNGGNNSGFVKSRRSSRSELYTSESNWMEPSTTAIEGSQNRAIKTRNSIHDHVRLNTDVKQIYRSFTQRNLSQYTNDLKSNADSKSVKSQARKIQPAFNPVKIKSPAMGTLHRKGSYANSVISGRTGYDSNSRYNGVNELPIPHSKSTRRDLDQQRQGNYKVKLNSSEVYKMISESRSNKNLNGIITGSRDIKSQERKESTGGFASRLFGW